MNWNKYLIDKGYKRQYGDKFGQIAQACASMTKAGMSQQAVEAKLAAQYPLVVKRGLADKPAYYATFAPDGMPYESSTYDQMNLVARLPVYAGGALMPDAHPGYGLPVGGVCLLNNAIAPNLIGVDIACRVTCTLFLMARSAFEQAKATLRAISRFGFATLEGDNAQDHPVMDDALWYDNQLLHGLKGKAYDQLGSSGSGNHFLDLCEVETDQVYPNGQKLYALVSHSGSRGVGAQVGKYYSKLAAANCPDDVPADYSYFDADSELGKEYWNVMQLMGRYAQACHHIIHARFYAAMGDLARNVSFQVNLHFDEHAEMLRQVYCKVDGRSHYKSLWILENHHNFAWRVVEDEQVYYIHRKGATPAGKGQYGIIPGSSGSNIYLVVGQGHPDGLQSTSHGAGRMRSRSATAKLHDPAAVAAHYAAFGTETFGVAPDETVFAYKSIDKVMAAQRDLATIVGTLKPVFVVMGGIESDDGD